MANLLFRASSAAATPNSTTVKDAPLTNLEIDGNFKSINDDLANKPPLTGTGATGTWNISITGNAATATNADTVTDGVVTTGLYADPNWITSLSGNKLTGTVVATNGVVTTGSYADPNWITSLDETKVLPTQSNNTGKYLTTNGISTFWGDISQLPDQTGNTNELLVTNGTTADWSEGLTYSSGTLTTTNFNATSDISLKKNIQTVDSALSIINKLNGIEFEWKNTGKKSSGIIAQELEEVLPHLVETNDDGIKTVNYAGLSAYLIQAIKELTEKVK